MVFAACLASAGCLGPKAVQQTRTRYNEVYRSTSDEQLLMNIVRLRYADSPVFIDLPHITSQFELAAGGSDPGPSGSQTNFGVAGLWGRDTPTLSYHPREGREIAKALLTPLSAELFSIVNAGANIEQLLLMTINDINDVPNAPQATAMVPRVPDGNAEFLQGVRLLNTLQDRGAVELALQTTEDAGVSSDPIPEALVQGRDVLSAAKDGYVYRAKTGGRMALLKQEKGLVLKVRPRYVHSPEMEELARLFRVAPGLSRYKIESELTGDTENRSPNPLGEDTVFLNMRSILQIMVFLSKGVCVPEEHIATGVAPTTLNPDGSPFDWTRVTAGHFFVASQKHRPRDSEVAVHYRGYWFSIARNDVNSRAVLAILEILSSLQESDGKTVGPLLTLPLGG
ncbi:MAG: hypothetical protein P4L84_28060 [Isosphaeraceae bacterium]|nr:hypothetical protein [Isosphaeraceae bacterium]